MKILVFLSKYWKHTFWEDLPNNFQCVCTCVPSVQLFATYGLYPVRQLGLWDFPGKDTGVGYHFLLQGIFLTQGLNPSFLSFCIAGEFFTVATREALVTFWIDNGWKNRKIAHTENVFPWKIILKWLLESCTFIYWRKNGSFKCLVT